jgi:hypothetical protein
VSGGITVINHLADFRRINQVATAAAAIPFSTSATNHQSQLNMGSTASTTSDSLARPCFATTFCQFFPNEKSKGIPKRSCCE